VASAKSNLQNEGISPQRLGQLRGLSPQQQEREKNFNKLQKSSVNEQELTRLMANPVKAKMPMAQSKIMNSQPSKTAEGGKLMVGSDAQVSSWSGKQGSAVPLPPMQTNTIIS
jgi:hypothetical protein